METESEPYVRLATFRQLHQVVAALATARSLPDTVQAIADGVVSGLQYELAAVNLVRSDGDLVVAAVAGSEGAEALMAGRVGPREAWDRRMKMAQRWGALCFIPHEEGWVLDDDEVPSWHLAGPEPRFPDEWHPGDRLFAPFYDSPGGSLLGVLSVDRPRNWRRPGPWGQEALQMYACQSAIAIVNARLRSNMQRAMVRLEREQQALRASEDSFRQAFEYAPSGMAIAEIGGAENGRLVRINDALCRLLGRPAGMLQKMRFVDLVHSADVETLQQMAEEGGRAEVRLVRRDGSTLWVSLRNSVVVDTADGPLFRLTHVEDIEERKRHELHLAHRASHDALTGLANGAELRARLEARLCSRPGPAVRHPVLPHHQPDHQLDGPRLGGYGAASAQAETAGFAAYGHPGPGADAALPAMAEGGRETVAGPLDDGLSDPHGGVGYGIPDGFGPTALPGSGRPRTGAYEHAHVLAPSGGPEDDGAKGLAVLFCDLDGFKSINDRFGHQTGDAVLIEVARRLTAGVRDGDTVARLGGDEFVVLADGLDRSEAKDLAARLRNAITPPIRVDGRAVRVGASFGIGWASCGASAEEVLESADQRMYVEKRRSKQGRGVG